MISPYKTWVSSWHPITHPGISELQIFLLAIKWPCGWVWSPVGAVKYWLLFLTVHMPILSSYNYGYWPNHSLITVFHNYVILWHIQKTTLFIQHTGHVKGRENLFWAYLCSHWTALIYSRTNTPTSSQSSLGITWKLWSRRPRQLSHSILDRQFLLLHTSASSPCPYRLAQCPPQHFRYVDAPLDSQAEGPSSRMILWSCWPGGEDLLRLCPNLSFSALSDTVLRAFLPWLICLCLCHGGSLPHLLSVLLNPTCSFWYFWFLIGFAGHDAAHL